MAPAIGFLFYYIGIVIQHAKQNWFLGIRTPWTLSHEMVWEKTHKIGSKLFKIVGFVFLFAMILGGSALVLLIVLLIAMAVFLYLYSYLEYQKVKTSDPKTNKKTH